jgi:DNA polymerase III subunit gamma/tau
MDDMPPPWDEDVMFSSMPAQNNSTIPSYPLESDYEVSIASVIGVAEVATFDVDIAQSANEVAPAISQIASTPAPAARPLELKPMAELSWDGHWPNLAASLPVRGVAQQLAQQSELLKCEINGKSAIFYLRVPVSTLLSSGSVDKLIAALNERFVDTDYSVRIETEIGAVEQTANAQAVAERAARQVQAERSIQSDSFVQTLMREFGASIVTGSIQPI